MDSRDGPEITPAQLAAVLAAVELVWPGTPAPAAAPPSRAPATWRFSNRWWVYTELAPRTR